MRWTLQVIDIASQPGRLKDGHAASRNDGKSVFELDNEDQVTKEIMATTDGKEDKISIQVRTKLVRRLRVLREVNPSSKRKWEGNHHVVTKRKKELYN